MGGRSRDGYFQREPSVMKRLGVIKNYPYVVSAGHYEQSYYGITEHRPFVPHCNRYFPVHL